MLIFAAVLAPWPPLREQHGARQYTCADTATNQSPKILNLRSQFLEETNLDTQWESIPGVDVQGVEESIILESTLHHYDIIVNSWKNGRGRQATAAKAYMAILK